MYMGNSIYKEGYSDGYTSDDLINKINKIATEYIIKQNYSDMKQILDKNKYDEILDLVTTILSKNIKTDDIDVLVSALYSSELDSRNTHLKKCRKIAVFYLKITHLFDSIMMTINPHREITSDVKLDDAKVDDIKHVNTCTRRLNALINANIKLGKPNEINIKSPACHINSESHTLLEEDGIPELETLYYDEYDFDSETFNKMSEKMKNEYKKDVELFYNVFSATATATAKADTESKAERFSDIKISDIITRDYDSICNSTDEYVYINRKKKAYRMEKERLFKDYAFNIKNMTKFIHKREQDLLYILNQVFKKDERNNEYNISKTIHSNTLDKLIDDARRTIVGFYSKCEEFYVDGVQIYDAIVQNQLKYTTIKQIQNSNVLLEKMLTDNEVENEVVEDEDENEVVEDEDENEVVEDEDEVVEDENEVVEDENEVVEDENEVVEDENEVVEDENEVVENEVVEDENESETSDYKNKNKNKKIDYSVNTGDIEEERKEV